MNRAASTIKKSLGSVTGTLASRLLGLLRVMLESRVLGGGAEASAWQLAFLVPNLFRRLFGEGALSTALVPLFLKIEHENGTENARRELGAVFAALSALLGVIVIAGGALSLLASWVFDAQGYVGMALRIIPVLMPYALFMCLVGVTGALLNTRGVFFLVSAGALIFNVVMVGVLWFFLKTGRPDNIFPALEAAVLTSGALDLAMMMFLMRKYRLTPIFQAVRLRGNPVMKELSRLLAPGIIGVSAYQISTIIDNAVAAWVGPQAVPALNYSSRIIDLPVGIYAISLSMVLLPAMSRSAASGKLDEIAGDLEFGLRNVLFICVPSALFLMFFGESVIRTLYFGGRFCTSDLNATLPALFYYSLGIPFFCAVKVITPAFHSRKQMKIPMYSTFVAIGLNIVLNFALVVPMKQGGVALATAVSSLANNAFLLAVLHRQGFSLGMTRGFAAFIRAAGASAAGVAAAYFATRGMNFRPAAELAIQCGAFGAAYFAIMAVLRGRELGEMLSVFSKRRG